MRTSEERTSGAWTDGCETITDGGKEETALQALAIRQPKDTRGA